MSTPLTPEQGASLLDRVRQSVATRVVGQEATVTDTLVAFLARQSTRPYEGASR